MFDPSLLLPSFLSRLVPGPHLTTDPDPPTRPSTRRPSLPRSGPTAPRRVPRSVGGWGRRRRTVVQGGGERSGGLRRHPGTDSPRARSQTPDVGVHGTRTTRWVPSERSRPTDFGRFDHTTPSFRGDPQNLYYCTGRIRTQTRRLGAHLIPRV